MDKVSEKLSAYLSAGTSTKRDLASMLGITVKTLNAKLRGETVWRWSQVCMIADVLGCSLSDLR